MSQTKYEEMKAKAIGWMEKAVEYEGEIERLTREVELIRTGETEITSGLRQDLSTLDKAYTKLETDNERVIMRKDAEIDRLKNSLDHYKDRYNEIRDDNKELRKFTRNI